MKQTSKILPPARDRKNYQVNFMRDDVVIMRIQMSSRRPAEVLADAWNQNSTMGEIAERMQEMGMKL